MQTAYRVIVVVGVSYFLLNLYSYIWPEWLCVMLATVTLVSLVLGLLVTAILGFVRWRSMSRLWMVPLLICLVFISSTWWTPPMGRFIADWRFRQQLTEYTKVVNEISSGANSSRVPTGASLAIIDEKNPPRRVRAVKAARCDNGAMVVAFLMNTDVPQLHEGYVYKGYDEGNGCIKDSMRPEENWPYIRHVNGNWYHFSDQPGL